MTQWIRISPDFAEKWYDWEMSGTIERRIQPSPYDVPIALRAYFRKPENRAVIEFRYLDKDEPTIRVGPHSDVDFIIGQHSKRLMAIEVKLRSSETPDAIAKSLRSDPLRGALRRLRIATNDETCRDNYELTERIVEERTPQIVEELISP
jgi:hypothetical protein